MSRQGVKQCIFTSSMSAMAPQTDPEIKDESHWSDSDLQLSKNN